MRERERTEARTPPPSQHTRARAHAPAHRPARWRGGVAVNIQQGQGRARGRSHQLVELVVGKVVRKVCGRDVRDLCSHTSRARLEGQGKPGVSGYSTVSTVLTSMQEGTPQGATAAHVAREQSRAEQHCAVNWTDEVRTIRFKWSSTATAEMLCHTILRNAYNTAHRPAS